MIHILTFLKATVGGQSQASSPKRIFHGGFLFNWSSWDFLSIGHNYIC